MGPPASRVAVIGLDDEHAAMLRRTPSGGQCVIEPLFRRDEVRGVDELAVEPWLREAEHRIAQMPSPPDAILSYWDFPIGEMAAILAAERGLPTASLDCLVRLQHKYLARLLQRRAVPEAVPAFEAVDVFDDDAVASIGLELPFWLKPVRSFRSHLGFRVRDARDLRAAVLQLREGLPRLADPYDDLLARIDLPDEAAHVGGRWCIAEALIGGRQCTLEGWTHRGETVIYGAVDSVREPNMTSFARYQYPSRLPGPVLARMADVATRVIDATGCADTAFNVEMFWDRARDSVHLLEVNARASASHFAIFEMVDGVANVEVLLALALGRRPEMPSGGGGWPMAAKCFLRAYDDAVVRRTPTPPEIEAVERAVPGTKVHIDAQAGDRLSDLPDQDSYSYEIGHVIVGGTSERDLLARFRECRERLGYGLALGATT